MADSGNRIPGDGSPPVPRLIDVYKSQREALRTQSRDLARLRQEIRGTAEREAQEIVEAARSNVRQILVNARRELLVLAAQVQAAIDDPERKSGEPPVSNDDARLLDPGTDTTDLMATRDLLVGARQGMHEIIDDARPHLDALADEARVLRGALAQADTFTHADVFPSEASLPDGSIPLRPEPASPVESAAPTPPWAAHDIPAPMLTTPWADESARAAVPAALTLSIGRPRKDAVPSAPLRTFVVAFAVIGTVVVVGTMGWLRIGPKGVTSKPAAAAAAAPSQPPAPTPAAAPAVARHVPSRELPVLSLQARRDVWIRTTIDGRGDVGRLLHAGDTQEITGAREVAIRAGDAGALWVSVNGSEPARVGRDGEVLTRRFDVQPPLPASSGQPAAPESNQGTSGRIAATDGQGARDEGPATPSRASTGTMAPAPIAPNPPPESGAAARDAKPRSGEAPARPADAPAPAGDPFGIAQSADGRLVAAAERWLDAYYRGERASAGAPQPVIKDERTSDQRLPPRLPEVHRTLDDVRLQLVGDSALITAKMTEQSLVGDRNVSHDSLVSQMWMRSGGSWRLVDVRIISEPKVRGE